jgi:hypothetical protein
LPEGQVGFGEAAFDQARLILDFLQAVLDDLQQASEAVERPAVPRAGAR